MGPQHPSTHGVFRVVVRTDGEIVPRLRAPRRLPAPLLREALRERDGPAVGPLHRPPRLPDVDGQQPRLLDRVREALGIVIPERAQYIRIIVTELNRIASHLMAIGTYGMDIGAITPFLYCFRDREKILYILETICGARLNYNYVWVGGVATDLRRQDGADAGTSCAYFQARATEYNDLLSTTRSSSRAPRNIGVCPADVAIPTAARARSSAAPASSATCARTRRTPSTTGSSSTSRSARASGPARRLLRPLHGARSEMIESLKIVEQALEPAGKMERTDVHEKVPERVNRRRGGVQADREPARSARVLHRDRRLRQSLPREGQSPSSHHQRPPRPHARLTSADLVAIIGSLDVVLGEIDR